MKVSSFRATSISRLIQNHQIHNGIPYVSSIADLSRFGLDFGFSNHFFYSNADQKMFSQPLVHYVGSKFCVESISDTPRAIGGHWSTQNREYRSKIQKSQLWF